MEGSRVWAADFIAGVDAGPVPALLPALARCARLRSALLAGRAVPGGQRQRLINLFDGQERGGPDADGQHEHPGDFGYDQCLDQPDRHSDARACITDHHLCEPRNADLRNSAHVNRHGELRIAGQLRFHYHAGLHGLGKAVTFVSAGSCGILANQAGNKEYAAVPVVGHMFTVTAAA